MVKRRKSKPSSVVETSSVDPKKQKMLSSSIKRKKINRSSDSVKTVNGIHLESNNAKKAKFDAHSSAGKEIYNKYVPPFTASRRTSGRFKKAEVTLAEEENCEINMKKVFFLTYIDIIYKHFYRSIFFV